MKAAKIGGIFVAALLLLYVLSVGPANAWGIRLAEEAFVLEGEASDAAFRRAEKHAETIKTLYAPLGWLSGKSEVTRWALQRYVELWRPDMGSVPPKKRHR